VALEIEIVPLLSDNYGYLLHETSADVRAFVDPAVAAPVVALLEERGCGLDWILVTHHHADHVGGVLELKRRYGCKVAGPGAESAPIPGLDHGLREGDRFALGAEEAEIFETPGHTAGHISYWFEAASALFCADTLFSLGCGRLFEGSPELMWQSLAKLRALPDATLVYCGHEYTLSNARFALTIDPDNPALRARAARVEELRAAGLRTVPSQLGEEKAANPFLRPDDPAIRKRLALEQAPDHEVFAEIRRRKDRA
jgi:hydroxyacylglutathione hydrolase